MTDSFTPCCKRHLPDACRSAPRWVALLAVLWLWCAMALPALVHAQPATAISELRVERTDEGLFLSAALQLELPALVEDALYQGIPVFFVAEAEVLRERWYWSAQRVARSARYMRLSYQPLTRRWRLAVSANPIDSSGLGVVLGQNYDGLEEALLAMQRIAQWKIAESPAIEPGERYSVHLRFSLDTSQLPRPLQIGALGRSGSGWNISMARSLRLTMESAKSTTPP